MFQPFPLLLSYLLLDADPTLAESALSSLYPEEARPGSFFKGSRPFFIFDKTKTERGERYDKTGKMVGLGKYGEF